MKELLNVIGWVIYFYLSFFLLPLLVVVQCFLVLVMVARLINYGWLQFLRVIRRSHYWQLVFAAKRSAFKVRRIWRVAQQ